MDSRPSRNRLTVAPGIRRQGARFYVDVKFSDGRAKYTSFPLDTPLAAMQAWRDSQRREHVVGRWDEERDITSYPKSLDGWCYLYVIRSGAHVKIGRAVDVRERMRNLQTSHPTPLHLVVAVPIHGSLEPVVHQRLAPHRTSGEWYAFNEEIAEFIEFLRLGRNPVAWVWRDAQHEARVAVHGDGGPLDSELRDMRLRDGKRLGGSLNC